MGNEHAHGRAIGLAQPWRPLMASSAGPAIARKTQGQGQWPQRPGWKQAKCHDGLLNTVCSGFPVPMMSDEHLPIKTNTPEWLAYSIGFLSFH
ncbi:MAG: hypothetical protein U1E15_13685 [Hyphomicrobiales bacterium]